MLSVAAQGAQSEGGAGEGGAGKSAHQKHHPHRHKGDTAQDVAAHDRELYGVQDTANLNSVRGACCQRVGCGQRKS